MEASIQDDISGPASAPRACPDSGANSPPSAAILPWSRVSSDAVGRGDINGRSISWGSRGMIKRLVWLLVLSLAMTATATADYRVTRDHGGDVEQYKTRWRQIRDSGERVIIDGICNSACTLV